MRTYFWVRYKVNEPLSEFLSTQTPLLRKTTSLFSVWSCNVLLMFVQGGCILLNAIDYSVLWGNTTDTLFLQSILSSGSLHISFQLSSVHSFPFLHIVQLAFLVIVSPQLYPAKRCLPGFHSLSLVQNYYYYYYKAFIKRHSSG